MCDSSSRYETRAATEARIEQAQHLHGKAWPNIAALSPIGLYLGIAAAIVLGAAINAAPDRPSQLVDHGTTAPREVSVISGVQQNAVVPTEPLGGTAGILHASAVLDPDESPLWLCVTAENCHEVGPPVKVVGRVRTAKAKGE